VAEAGDTALTTARRTCAAFTFFCQLPSYDPKDETKTGTCETFVINAGQVGSQGTADGIARNDFVGTSNRGHRCKRGFDDVALANRQPDSETIDDATLHALVQRMGARAEAQAQSRYEQPPVERLPQRGPSALGVLMVDGCQLRYRGPGWGKKKTKKDRVEWHELKLGVFYRQELSAHTETGRGLLIDKLVVNWQAQARELGSPARRAWACQASIVFGRWG
jgi:hypothetical protein